MSNSDKQETVTEAMNKLRSTDPVQFLTPSSDLSLTSRLVSQHLFTSLKPYSKSPFEQLLVDGFDAEQIWQQIDLQSQPLISSLKREIKRFEKNPNQISSLFVKSEANGELVENGEVGLDGDVEEFEGLSDEGMLDGFDEEDEEGGGDEEEEEEDDDDEDDDDEGEDDDGDGVPEVEDEFLKIRDLEKYLVREEKREYGSEEKNNDKKLKKKANDAKVSKKDAGEDEDAEGEDESEDNQEVDDGLLMYAEDDDDEGGSGKNARYQDFFVPERKMAKRKQKQVNMLDGSETETEDENNKQKESLSTHEKERQKLQAKIKEMEEMNMEPKEWVMQGEVTAAKRPKDSALEVDLDFEHNVRPPPVITEEVTTSLEEIIKKRILEGNFDDVQRLPKLPSTAPKETKELDDNKSKKGLAEIYEEEYAQQTGFASAPLSFNDELKKEASILFKRLCLKLDALSHFHFAPKPVVEDMSVQTNVPALAMEEIAPVAVSDAAMLAPEEVFAGKGDVKEETELTKEDKKRRRARKKRKFKAQL